MDRFINASAVEGVAALFALASFPISFFVDSLLAVKVFAKFGFDHLFAFFCTFRAYLLN